MAGAAIPDQVNASKGVKRLEQAGQRSAQVFAVVFIQTAASHVSVVDVEQDKEVDDTMPFILKLLAFNLT